MRYKIRPPPEFKEQMNVEIKDDFIVKEYREQRYAKTTKKGIYEIMAEVNKNSIYLKEFKDKIEFSENDNFDNEEAIENAINNFWMNMENRCNRKQKNKDPIIYGNDVPGSLFPDTVKLWNLNKFTGKNSIIHMMPKKKWLPGIHKPYLYIGSKYSVFSLHAEDRFLQSINYNHFGAPKIWYGLYREHKDDIMMLTANCIKNTNCDNILYHKGILVSPTTMTEENLNYCVVIIFFIKNLFESQLK